LKSAKNSILGERYEEASQRYPRLKNNADLRKELREDVSFIPPLPSQKQPWKAVGKSADAGRLMISFTKAIRKVLTISMPAKS